MATSAIMRGKPLAIAVALGLISVAPGFVETASAPQIDVAKGGQAQQVEAADAPYWQQTGARCGGWSIPGEFINVDPASGAPVRVRLSGLLSAGWGKGGEHSERVDSYGDPIVNEVLGLPAWSQRNVAALRTAIGRSLAALAGPDRAEREWVLGNYLGQALVRGIDVSDLVDPDDEIVSTAVVQSILEQIRFYEDLKAMRAKDFGYSYRPSVYSDETQAWIDQHAGSPAALSSTEPTTPGGAKATPSGCYTKTEFTRGMSLLADPVVIWDRTDSDNVSRDVPIGFRFYFYACDDPDANLNVRVSTEGYLTFFEQGGGAEYGPNWRNSNIPFAPDPDGYVAASWDDLWIAPSQGAADVVGYLTEGVAGNRIFTVEWASVSHYDGGTDEYQYFQVKLFEATGNIELHFGTAWIIDTYDSSTVGMEDFDGLDGDCGPNCLNNNTSDTITANYRFAPNRPGNDACDRTTAVCLAPDSPSWSGNSLGATGTDVSTCGVNDPHDVWFWYHSPRVAAVDFRTCDSSDDFDTTLSVFTECGGIEYVCNDDGCGLHQSSMMVALTGAQDYYLRLAGADGIQGDYIVTMRDAGEQPWDSCVDARTLGPPYAGSTSNNTGCLDESLCGWLDTVDEWHAWTAPQTGMAWATTCRPNTDFNTTLAVFDACGGAQLACNNDSPHGQCSAVQWSAVAGATYFIRVAGQGRTWGTYKLAAGMDLIFVNSFE